MSENDASGIKPHDKTDSTDRVATGFHCDLWDWNGSLDVNTYTEEDTAAELSVRAGFGEVTVSLDADTARNLGERLTDAADELEGHDDV